MIPLGAAQGQGMKTKIGTLTFDAEMDVPDPLPWLA